MDGNEFNIRKPIQSETAFDQNLFRDTRMKKRKKKIKGEKKKKGIYKKTKQNRKQSNLS